MNFFDDIIPNPVDQFTKKPVQQPIQSFQSPIPVAPRTVNYQQPIVKPILRNNGFAPWFEWTIDETKSPVFKAIQGAADVITSIPWKLQETVWEDQKRFDEEMKQKRVAFANDMLSKWYKKEDIFKAFDSLKAKWEFDFKPWFAWRLLESGANRLNETIGTTERISKQGPTLKSAITAPIAYAGDVAGGITDVAGAALQPIVEPIIKSIPWTTEWIQKFWDWYSVFKKENPNLADVVEWWANLASLAPISPKITQPIKETVKKTIMEWVEKIIPSSEKIVQSADEALRKQAEEIALPRLQDMGMREKSWVARDVIETPWIGPFKKQELVRSPQEALAIEETARLMKEWKVKKWASELSNASAIDDEIGTLSKELEWKFVNSPNQPVLKKVEVESFIDDISKKVIENPSIVGSSEQSAMKLITEIKKWLTKEDYSPSDLLQLRKDLDAAIKRVKWEGAFDPKLENAFTTAFREFRQGINGKINELVPDAKVRQTLDRQSALYTARETLDARWAKQSNSIIWQALNKIQNVTWIPRTEIIELWTALGLIGVSAPIVAPISTAIATWYGIKKWLWIVLSPKNKIRIANIVEKLDDAIKKNPWKEKEISGFKNLFIKTLNYGWNTIIPGVVSNTWLKKPIEKK